MKKLLCVATFISFFSFFVLAQQAPLPTANHGGKTAVHHDIDFLNPGEPGLCHGKCPFYGGDIDLNDPNADGFANGNTTLVPFTYIYSALIPPINVMVTGMVINHLPTVAGGVQYDPVIGIYDVRTGISEGNCGTDVGGGQNKLYEALTGRNVFGFAEESVGSEFTSPISLTAGTAYWFNYLPQCTASDCDSNIYYFESNTDGLNGVNAKLQPSYEIFLNSDFFGDNCENVCGIVGGGNTTKCQGMSYALAGHK